MSVDRSKAAQRATWIGFFVNIFLTIGKLIAGFLGNSAAMIADGIHSLSDFVTDLIVIIFIRISSHERDENHPYGHGKFETLASVLISVALAAVAVGIFVNGIQKIYAAFQGEIPEVPAPIALIAAVVSIAAKEILYHYTVHVGKSIECSAVIANAWHHRSDALSSIGTLIGVGGAFLLGGKFAVLDPIAAVVVSFFIARVAFQIGFPSIQELLEASLPPSVEKEIADIIRHTDKVRFFHNLQTRKIGNSCAIDVHIKLDRDISLVEAHDVATEIEQNLRKKFGQNMQINIHMEPVSEKGNA